MNKLIANFFLFFFVVFAFQVFQIQTVFAQLRLPALVSDSMILQRDRPVNIWGWAKAGEEVTVAFLDKKLKTITAANKKWLLQLPATRAGVSTDIVISTKTESRIIRGALFGDVWICSGQSNMEFDMGRLRLYAPQDLAGSRNPYIRQFLVERVLQFNNEAEDVSGKWEPASPATIGRFTAVGYYMAKDLYAKYKVPIGLLHSSWGGTPAEAWISRDSLKFYPHYQKLVSSYSDKSVRDSLQKCNAEATEKWYAEVNGKDVGSQQNWERSASFNDWKITEVPSTWDSLDITGGQGIVWYYREFDLKSSEIGKDALLNLGMLDEQDITYINGIKVGSVGSRYLPRQYKLGNDILKTGKNTIVVQLTNPDGPGGFISGKTYELTVGSQTIDLAGKWYYKQGASMPQFTRPAFYRFHYLPTVLYNAMVAPLTPYTIQGAVWYQGEANTSRAAEYKGLLTTLINDWRSRWGYDFPFVIVQLANYLPVKPEPAQSDWAELREAQMQVSQTVPNAALATAVDLGETYDVHPLRKREIGERAALAAISLSYDPKIKNFSGPVYKDYKIKNRQIIIQFDQIGEGLVTNDNKAVRLVEIAGADKKFVWANSKIVNNTLIVSSDQIESPVAVRYAWSDNPLGANLYNKAGLPALPFRTDSDKK